MRESFYFHMEVFFRTSNLRFCLDVLLEKKFVAKLPIGQVKVSLPTELSTKDCYLLPATKIGMDVRPDNSVRWSIWFIRKKSIWWPDKNSGRRKIERSGHLASSMESAVVRNSSNYITPFKLRNSIELRISCN